MTFKPHEIEYLKSADLGRLATIAPDGTLQNSPVGFSYNDALGTLDVVGYNMAKSRKFRNLATNNTVAFVVDDIASRSPWRVRCLEIRGTAEQAEAPDGGTRSSGSRPNGSSASASTTPRPSRTTWCRTAGMCRRRATSAAAPPWRPPRRTR